MRWNGCPDPDIAVRGVGDLPVGLRVSCYNDVVSLTNADEDARGTVISDWHEVGTNNFQLVVVNGKDESGAKGGIDDTKKISEQLAGPLFEVERVWSIK